MMELSAQTAALLSEPPRMTPQRPTPLDILSAAMRARWNAGNHDAAVSLAAKAAPYVHPRALAAPLQQDLRHIPDGQLDLLCGFIPRAPGEGDPARHPHQPAGLE